MRVAIITDTHFGARSDSQHFLSYFERFYENTFFPNLHRLGIQRVIHAGDLVDRRKYINYATANRMRRAFLEPLKAREIFCDFLVGNHDAYYRDRNDINALTEIIAETGHFRVHERTHEIGIEGFRMLLVPWICEANREASLDLISRSMAKVCIGHLELRGFEVLQGRVMETGLDPALFDKFALTLSGHYHHQSVRGNIRYLGAPYEMTWSDYGCDRGFWILDTNGPSLSYIQNPEVIHKKIFYDDSSSMVFEMKDYIGKVVKVIVKTRTNHALFDSMIEALEKVAANVQVIEDELLDQINSEEVSVDNVTDPFDVLLEMINDAPVLQVDRVELGSFMRDLYMEAARANGE